MKFKLRPMVVVLCLVLLCTSVTAVFADWLYFDTPATVESSVTTKTGNFKYGLLYITNVAITGGDYVSANATKTGDTSISADISLTNSNDSSVTVAVTFYNSTEVTYYYDETQTASSNNPNITYTVTGIVQADEVTAGSYKTIDVTFSYASNTTVASLLASLNFKFTIDKESIEDIVAESAVDRFADVLNNVVSENSYNQLITAMDNRSGFNKGSAITYIGNVAGANSGDSATINTLFGEEFMSMDLDGDGNTEPITMLIKRENLDNDTTTGASYTYSTWRGDTTVNGVEMTIYITAQDFSNVRNGDSITVYAATYTKLYGATEWTNLLPLTKGTAPANNYAGYGGTANSFNTDNWVSEQGYDIKTLI